MKSDHYAKIILTVIAVGLILNLFQIQNPQANAQAPLNAKFDYIRPMTDGTFFDTRTGDIWTYNLKGGFVISHVRLEDIGKPLNITPR